jgi:hypothetical protein
MSETFFDRSGCRRRYPCKRVVCGSSRRARAVAAADSSPAHVNAANITDINILSADLTTTVQTIVITTTTTAITKACSPVVPPPATGPGTITITCV